MSKRVYPKPITIYGTNVDVLFGEGLVGTGVDANLLTFTELHKPGKIGKGTVKNTEGAHNVTLIFTKAESVDVIIDALKEVKKTFTKRKK